MTSESETPIKVGMPPHPCCHDGCKTYAPFGYNTRSGTLWFCHEHKDEGEAQRIQPGFHGRT
jgi:hypothetical protein